MIAMLVSQEDTVEFVRLDPAESEPEDELARAQPAIDQEPAMIGRDQGTVPGASAPEHGQTKHARYLAGGEVAHK